MPVHLAPLTLALSLAVPHPGPGPGMLFIDVGQGAAALIVDGEGAAVLVDSGPASGAEAVTWALGQWEVEALSLWVHTHFDADHIGAFGPVWAGRDGRLGTADDLDVAQLWDRGRVAPVPQTDAASIYFSWSAGLREAPQPGAVFRAQALRVEVLALDAPLSEDTENERGLALCVELGRVRALFPGDLSAARATAAAEACGGVDLLWASHHGASDGTSNALLDGAQPRLTVISAGHDNAYCHPAPLSLARLQAHRVAILDGAGLELGGSCASSIPSLGPAHEVLAGSLWISADTGEAWVGEPGGWSRVPSLDL